VGSDELLFVLSEPLTASLAPISPCQLTVCPGHWVSSLRLPCYCWQHCADERSITGRCQSFHPATI